MRSESFIVSTDAWLLVLVLLLVMLLMVYVGRKVGFKSNQHPESNSGTVVSAILGLMAFLLAFTFGMSGARYDTRRGNIVHEANAIGTAILYADLYPEEERKAFRNDFKQYLEERIQYFNNGVTSESGPKVDYGKKLWDRAVRLSFNSDYFVAAQQMLPALTTMLDANTTRLIGEISRVPDSIVWMLFIIAVVSAFYLGYSSVGKGRIDWFVTTGFCVLTCVIIFITLDLDRPRRGLIQLTTSEKAMIDLRKLL